MLIEAELLPQGPQFASNILRFGEELEKLMKMLPEPDDTILMSVASYGYLSCFRSDWNGLKGKVDLLIEFPENMDIVIH